jgi:hypothetical protein
MRESENLNQNITENVIFGPKQQVVKAVCSRGSVVIALTRLCILSTSCSLFTFSTPLQSIRTRHKELSTLFIYTMINCMEISSCVTCLQAGHCKFIFYHSGATFGSPLDLPIHGKATILEFESGSFC